MAFNQVNALEFNQIKAQIKEYLRSQSQFSDYDFEGSSLTVLIDTLAYNTYYTSAVSYTHLTLPTNREV